MTTTLDDPGGQDAPLVRGAGVPDGAPIFDPAVHLDADGNPATDEPAYLELACACGAVIRQYDPPAYLVRTLGTWNERHNGGLHRPASLADAVAEREARREAAFRAAGRQDQYTPAEPPADAGTELRAWPELPAAGTDQSTEG